MGFLALRLFNNNKNVVGLQLINENHLISFNQQRLIINNGIIFASIKIVVETRLAVKIVQNYIANSIGDKSVDVKSLGIRNYCSNS